MLVVTVITDKSEIRVCCENAFEDPKFINVISPLSIGISVLEICLVLDRQTVTERILRNTLYRLFHISLHSMLRLRLIDTHCAALP
jgi:hypothetical protein